MCRFGTSWLSRHFSHAGQQISCQIDGKFPHPQRFSPSLCLSLQKMRKVRTFSDIWYMLIFFFLGGGWISTRLCRVTKFHPIYFFFLVDGRRSRLNNQEVLWMFVRMRITEPTNRSALFVSPPCVCFVKYCWKADKFYISPVCRVSVWYIGRSGIRIPVGERDFLLLQKHPDRLWGSQGLLVDIGSFPRAKSDGARS